MENKDTLYKVFYFYWFISLFHIPRIIGNFIPPMHILNSFPNLFFLVIIFFWIFSDNYQKKFSNPAVILFIIYLISMFFSTLISRNTGRARSALIEHFYLLLRITITLSIFNDHKKSLKFLMLYFHSLIFLGILGVIYDGRISYIPQLNDEDAYGPLMAYGISFAWFLSLSECKKKNKRKYFILFLFFIFALGYSHARGALIALGVLLVYLLYKHPHKIRTIFKYSILIILVIFILITYFSESSFVMELLSILDEREMVERREGTGASRLFLWSMALNMLYDNNIFFGVGPNNFGVWLPEYAEIYRDQQVGLAYYGQVAHNDYITAITELGVVGFLLYIGFIIQFIVFNIKAQKLINKLIYHNTINFEYLKYSTFQKLKFMTFALQGCLIATLINHFFYALFYYLSFFWLIFILNLVNYQTIRKIYVEEFMDFK